MKMGARRGRFLSGVGALTAALALSGCVTTVGGVETTDYTPPPHWANIAGFENYEWIDRADALSQAIGEAPPDYSFYAAGGEPWAWTFDDGSLLLVENRPDGLHSYYFEGGADAPFLVRDAEMSYGFLEGGVAVIYGADGQVLTREESQGWLYAAVAGYQRGKMLRRAMIASQERRVVDTMAWLDTSYLWWNWRRDWDDGRRRHGGWRKVREGVAGSVRQRKWHGERQRRAEQGDRFRRWGEGGFRGRPPGNYSAPPAGTAMPPVTPQAQAPGGQPGPRGVRPGRPGARPEGGIADRPGGVRPRRDLDGDGVSGIQPDIGIAPGANGTTGVRGRPLRPATATQAPAPAEAAPAPTPQPQPGTRPGRPPRPGSESGFRPRPEPQGGNTPQPGSEGGFRPRLQPQGNPPQPVRSAPPVSSDTPAYVAPPAPPAPVRAQPPVRSVPSARPTRPESVDDGSRPSRPVYQAPQAQPVRSFNPPPAPSYTPPPAPSYSPPPAPSYSPPPAPTYSPPPAPSYSPPPPPPAPSYSAPPPPPPPPPTYSAPPPPPPPPPSPRYEAPTRIGDD